MASHEESRRAQVFSESGGEEEAEYESDSEQGTSALALRRRVASDDEEDYQEMNAERRPGYYNDGIQDQGAPPAEDEEEEEEEEYEDAEEGAGLAVRRRDMNEEEEDGDGGEELSKHHREDMDDVAGKAQGGAGNVAGGSKEGDAEEKKDAEPFVVPTAGAFYMHDDRFRYNGVARPRRSAGGRKLWESKDEKPWVHDRFEELKLNDESYHGQGVRVRRGRGREGRGQGRGKDPGHARGRGNKERRFEDALQLSSRRGSGRGWGLRRAKMDDYEFHSAGNRGLALFSGETSNSTSIPKPAPTQPTIKPQEAASKKPTTFSILNSASPPFFPSGTISHSLTGVLAGTSKESEEKSFERDARQVGRLVSTSRSGMEKGMTGISRAPVTRPSPPSPGNNTSLARVSNTGEVETGLHRALSRGPNTLQQQLMKTGSGSMLQQQRPVRAEGNAQRIVERPLHSAASQQSGRGTPSAAQSLRVQQPHQQLQTSQGQISQGQPVQSQSVVSPVSLSAKPAVDVKAAPPSPGNKPGSGAIVRGTQAATAQAGRGSFMYGGSSLTNGLRSVVQFAGQPQGGLGVPAVGVALSGYSSQPQFGFPNSEVTWIPILAGGGSLGSNYSSPYIAVDGGSPGVYYSQQASQPSAFPVPGREIQGAKAATSSSFKPPARPEPDEFGQQRRRYSQMTFGEERR